MSVFCASTALYFRVHDVHTQDAGSAEAFKRVDYEYVRAGAAAAKTGGASHFALVSSMGADAGQWANDW